MFNTASQHKNTNPNFNQIPIHNIVSETVKNTTIPRNREITESKTSMKVKNTEPATPQM